MFDLNDIVEMKNRMPVRRIVGKSFMGADINKMSRMQYRHDA